RRRCRAGGDASLCASDAGRLDRALHGGRRAGRTAGGALQRSGPHGLRHAAGTVAELCKHPGIIGIKEARGDEERWSALYPLASANFSLLSGDDPTFVRALRGGASGVISVASNVVPRVFSKLCALLASGSGDAAVALDARLAPLYDFLGVESNPIPVKAVLQRLGIGTQLRLPLQALSPRYAGQADEMTALCRQ